MTGASNGAETPSSATTRPPATTRKRREASGSDHAPDDLHRRVVIAGRQRRRELGWARERRPLGPDERLADPGLVVDPLRHTGEHAGDHLSAALARERRSGPLQEDRDIQHAIREAPDRERANQIRHVSDEHRAASGQRLAAERKVAHDRLTLVADDDVGVDQPLGQLLVAEVILHRHHELPDHAAAHPQNPADRRQHQRAAVVVEELTGAEHAEAHDVLVVVDQREDLALNRREVVGGNRVRQHAVGFDRVQVARHLSASALLGADSQCHSERGREVGAVGRGSARPLGGSSDPQACVGTAHVVADGLRSSRARVRRQRDDRQGRRHR